MSTLINRRSTPWIVLLLFATILALGSVEPSIRVTSAFAAAGEAACEGDECQGPAPAPDDPAPGTAVVEGPQNPPVRFPKSPHGKKQSPGLKHGHGKHSGKAKGHPKRGQK